MLMTKQMQRRRILFLMDDLRNTAGTERIVAAVSSGLSEYHDVTLLTAWQHGEDLAFSLDKRVRHHDLGLRPRDYLFRYLLQRAYRARVAQFLQFHPQDVVIIMGGKLFTLLPTVRDGSKKVFWFHFCFHYHLLQLQASRSLVGRWVLLRKHRRRLAVARHYDEVLVLTKEDQSHWRECMPRVTQIYNELTIQPTAVQDYGVKRAVAAGRLVYQKGFDRLVAAWAEAHQQFPDWQLDIYGDGPLREELQRQINDLGLTGVVHLKGNHANLAELYSHYSLFALTSHYEGFGLVLVEAAACGLPLVAYRCEAGPSEIISNEENGYLVENDAPAKVFAQALGRLMESEERRRTMGQRAKEMITPFMHEEVMQQWNAFIERITER